jgi:hypothetical protein
MTAVAGDGETLSQAVARLTGGVPNFGPEPPRQIRANMGRGGAAMYESSRNDWARVDREKQRGYEAIRAAVASGEYDLRGQSSGDATWEPVDIDRWRPEHFDFVASALLTNAGYNPVRLFSRATIGKEAGPPAIPNTQRKRAGYVPMLQKYIALLIKRHGFDTIKNRGDASIAFDFERECAQNYPTLTLPTKRRSIEIQVAKIVGALERRTAHQSPPQPTLTASKRT